MLSLPEGDTDGDHDDDADYVDGGDYAMMIMFCIVEMMVKVIPHYVSLFFCTKGCFSSE